MQHPAEDVPPPARQVLRHAERELGQAEVPLARRLRLAQLVRLTVQQTGPHHLPAFAGHLAYNAFLALFPFFLLVLSILRAVHAPELLTTLVNVLAASLPWTSADLLRGQIQPDVASRLPDLWLLNTFLALGSLWAVSAMFRAVSAAMNVMYDVVDRRPLWARLALSLVLSLAAAGLLLTALGLLLGGAHLSAAVAASMHLDAPFTLIWGLAQWLILVACAFAAFAVLYFFAPDVKRSIRSVSPGALGATLAWLAFSLGFSFVLNHFGPLLVDPLYGWFTGLIALLLYLYWSSFILLVGAEVNHVVEAHGASQERAGRG